MQEFRHPALKTHNLIQQTTPKIHQVGSYNPKITRHKPLIARIYFAVQRKSAREVNTTLDSRPCGHMCVKAVCPSSLAGTIYIENCFLDIEDCFVDIREILRKNSEKLRMRIADYFYIVLQCCILYCKVKSYSSFVILVAYRGYPV